MSYISVEDFKGGLDRRNDRIAGADGSLWNIVNGHITRGGKVGRAKKFVSKYSVPGTFGLAGVNGQLFVFGSTADPGVPAGVTYQQLRHVDGSTAMTRLLDWQPFDGKIFAAAQFADNQIFEYNDGALVTDWVAGRVRADMGGVNGIASHLAALIDADSEYTATAVGTVLTVTGVANEAFTVTGVATNGGSVNDQTLTIARTQQAVPSTAEALATAAFRFVNGKFSPGFNQISSVIVDGVTITSTAIDYQASAALTAAAVAANINANTSIPDYTAVASGDLVVISAAAGSGSTANGLPVEVNVTGEVIVCTGGFQHHRRHVEPRRQPHHVSQGQRPGNPQHSGRLGDQQLSDRDRRGCTDQQFRVDPGLCRDCGQPERIHFGETYYRYDAAQSGSRHYQGRRRVG